MLLKEQRSAQEDNSTSQFSYGGRDPGNSLFLKAEEIIDNIYIIWLYDLECVCVCVCVCILHL